jgi:hypothetical protein
MKISELVIQLNKIKDQSGDLECWVDTGEKLECDTSPFFTTIRDVSVIDGSYREVQFPTEEKYQNVVCIG